MVLVLLFQPHYNKTLCSTEKSRKNDQNDGMVPCKKENFKRDVEKSYKITVEQGKSQVAKSCQEEENLSKLCHKVVELLAAGC